MGKFTILLLLPMSIRAEEPGALPAARQETGLVLRDVSPAQYMPSWLQIGGQIRGRFESPSGTSLLNSNSESYYLSRVRVDLAVKPAPWLRFFVQAQDARAGAYNTAPASATLYNPMDLRQGYFELAHEGRVSASLRAGRQEFVFGGERLIGGADWWMSRTFDAIDLTLGRGAAKVDFIAGSPVQTDTGRCDRHKPGEHLYAAYGRLTAFRATIEPYLLFKQNLLIKSETAATGDALVASPGVRVAGTLPGRFDYVAEGAVQRGTWSSDRISARAGTAMLGWIMAAVSWKPHVSVEYNYASGDRNARDGVRATFDQFYPSNHVYYGMIDQFGWRNLKNLRVGCDFVVRGKLKVRADYNDFRLATVQDSLYGATGAAAVTNRAATSDHAGFGLNTIAVYQWTKLWKFGAGIGHLYAGEYLRQSHYTAGYTYPYLMFAGTF
ncbi:MAG TPA: alginate export family protein [Candidatus Solibacter sp.]|nr:alginate export family protein [Candidatus Solibacter sp.]